MSDNSQNNDKRKAKIQEITIEVPIDSQEDNIKVEQIKPQKSKSNQKQDSGFLGEVNSMVRSIFSREKVDALKETVKMGTDVIKNYKYDKKKKVAKKDFVPNKVEIRKPEEKIDSKLEIEFGYLQVDEAPKTSIEEAITGKTKILPKVKPNSDSMKKKKKRNTNRKKPSNSFSAKASAFVELFEVGNSKGKIITDKDFQKFVSIAITLLIIFGAVWYGFKYVTTEEMVDVVKVSKSEYPGIIKPSTLLVERIPDVIEQLGEPKAAGIIDGTANEFVEYEGKWFGENTLTKIVYGPDNRVYFADIDFNSATAEKVYTTMVTYLGEPITNLLGKEENEATWFIDSTVYILSENGGKAVLSIQTPLYDNTNNYPIGEGAIIVEKQGAHDLTGDGINDVIVIIGEKESYFFKEYIKFHITLWDGENVFYLGFPTGTDGGSNPVITYKDVNGDNVMDVMIEARNNAINNYNVFTARSGNISSIYSSHEKN